MEDPEPVTCPVHGKRLIDFIDMLDGAFVGFECACTGRLTPDGIVELDSDSLAKVIPIRSEGAEVASKGKRQLKTGDAVLYKKRLWRVDYAFVEGGKRKVELSNNEQDGFVSALESSCEYIAKDTLTLSRPPRASGWDEAWRGSERRTTVSSSGKGSRYFGGGNGGGYEKPRKPPPAHGIDTASLIQDEVERLTEEDKADKAAKVSGVKPPAPPTEETTPGEPSAPMPKRRGDW